MVLLTLAAALALWAASIVRRARRRDAGITEPAQAISPDDPRADPRAWAAAHVVTFLAAWPLLAAAPAFLRARSLLPGDAPAFARVAATVAELGMPHGWIDVYAGGFPGALHYQPLPVAILVAAIRAGLHPVVATNLLGVLAVLALPQALLVALRWAGVGPLAALAGAVALTLTSPERPLVGGFDVVVAQGLIAQAAGMPILVLAGGAVLGRRARWALPLLAWLAAAAHPQLLVTGLGLGAVGLAVAGPRRHRDEARAFLLLGVASGVSLLALYGHGLATFHVPFGFPQLQGWRLLGFNPIRFTDFVLEGELLDRDRLPFTMAAWTAALVALAARADRGAPRALVALSILTVLLPFSGHFFADSRLLLKLVQVVTPTRAIAFTPIVCAASITLAADGARPLLARLPRRAGPLGALALIALFAAVASPVLGRLFAARARVEDAPACGGFVPRGYDPAVIAAWLRPLRGGRLHTDPLSFKGICPAMRGAHLASGAPIAEHTGGPGTQVGVTIAAMDALDLVGADGAARAEALGIRWVLHTTARSPGPPGAWRVVEQRESVVLSERIGGGDRWGAACVVSRWTGSSASLRAALLADFAARGPAIAAPARVVALEVGPDPLVVRATESPCQAEGARLDPLPREPGAEEATVDLPPGAVAVLRVTAHPSWTVRIDGGPPLTLGAGLTMVAPGYLAIPVPSGRHHVEAVVQLPRAYPLAVLASAVLVLAGAIGLRRRARA
jgi:hypothetical protein